MQGMQLDTVYASLYHAMERLQAFRLPFPRQTDNKVATDFQPALAGQTGGSLVTGEIMPTVNTVQRFIVRGLQTQLQPDFIPLIFVFA